MRNRSLRLLLALAALATALVAPPALAQTPLPDARTHVDAGEPTAVHAGDGPRLTLLAPDTTMRDVRRGYLYVKARCNVRCVVKMTARTRINGKVRNVAFKRRTLPTRKTRRVRMRIKSQYREKVSPTARFSYRAVPYPVD